MNARVRFTLALAAFAIVALATIGRAGDLNAYATCPDGQHLVVTWDWYETPGHPAPYPEWIGYDVMRRRTGTCDAPVRVNTDPFPRVVGQSHSGSYSEVAPVLHATFEYSVVPVDASHHKVVMNSIDCEPPCVPYTWASCPQASGILTMGTIMDWGWTVYIQPCTQGCWPGMYVYGPAVDELRAYIGSSQALAFYGEAGCGSVEGCAIGVEHYDIVGCGPVPTTRPSWGRVKTLYR